jgi:hypothetical protein
VLEGVQEVALPLDEMEDTADLYLPELLEERMVHRVLAAGILQRPVHLAAALGEVEMRVLARRDALIDGGKTLF